MHCAHRVALALSALALASSALAHPANATSLEDPSEQVVLVVANGSSLSDVGTAASLVAGGIGDAVLFAETSTRLGNGAAAIVASRKPNRVVLVGGLVALGAEVEDELGRIAPSAELERLAGTDRVHTAALAAERVLVRKLGQGALSVALANGWSLSDVATAASAVASGRAHAVLYAARGELGAPTATVLAEYQPSHIVVVGGPAALSDAVAQSAKSAAGASARPLRLGGATRIETAALSARRAFRADATTAVIADAWALGDVGLAASIAAAATDAAVLYAHDGEIPEATKEMLLRYEPDRVYVVDTSGGAEDLAEWVEAYAPAAAIILIASPTEASERFGLCLDDIEPGERSRGGGGGGSGGGGSPGGGGPTTVQTAPTVPIRPVEPALGVPTGLHADPGDTRLVVSWQPPDVQDGDIIGYRLRWKGPGQSYSDAERWDATTEQSYEIDELSNGRRYSVQVAAGIRPGGFGGWAEISAVPRTRPGTPRSLRISDGDEHFIARWQAPTDNGGSPVTGYKVQWLSDGSPVDSDDAVGLSHQVDGLKNGVEYQVRVSAVNGAGQGEWSQTAAVTPLGAPRSPTVVDVERGDRSASMSWQAPTDNGGSPITGYKVQWRTATQSFSSSRQLGAEADASSRRISGLSNGVEHLVRVVAVNSIGDGTPSVARPVTPATTPARPATAPTVDRGDGQLKVLWRIPADGGSPLTGITLQWSDDGFAQTVEEEGLGAAVTEHTIGSLTNGTEYSVRVRGVNSVGDGDWSALGTGTPTTTPSAPGDIDVDRGDRHVTPSWSAPDDGGSAILRYVVQWRAGDDEFVDADPTATVPGTALSRRIGSLTNGTVYFARVRAVNAVGEGPWSTSASATPAKSASQTRSVRAVASPEQVTVHWQAPASDGGEPVSAYKVQWRAEDEGYDSSNRQQSAGSADTSLTVSNLANGTRYYVRVIAVNSIGDGAASDEASAVPATTPDAPGDVAAERGDRSVGVSWSAAGDGGADVLRYRVRWRAGNSQFADSDASATTTGLTYRIGNLTNGTTYWVQVQAVNSVGDGPWATAASAVAATSPGQPRSFTVTGGDQSLSVAWQAPTGDGGLDISAYLVQWRSAHQEYDENDRQASVTDLSGLSHDIGSLTNGRQYFARVAAVNDVGAGRFSAERSAVPATAPDTPDDPTLAVRDRAIDVSWSAPASDGGATISGYRVQWRAADQQFDSAREASVGGSALRHSITGLTNGTQYFVQVQAANSAGSSPWSSATSAVPVRKPSAVASLELAPGDESITATWQAPSSSVVSEYIVQWRSADQEFVGSERQATVTSLSYVITGLENGSTYWVRVWAANAAGNGPPTTASANAYTTPGPPGTPVVNSADSSLTLSWDPPADDGGADVTGYTVQWKGPGQEYNTSDRQVTVSSPRHQITGLTNGEEYSVRITSVNAAGPGTAVEVSKTILVPPGAPQSQVVLVRNKALEVMWQAPAVSGSSAVTEYRVLWKGPAESYDDSRCSYRRRVIDADDELHVVVGPLKNARTYSLQILAVNDSGPGAPLEFTASPAAVPGPPKRLDVSSADGGLEVDWRRPFNGGSAITGYRVQWKGPGEEFSSTDRQATVTATEHTITGLTNGTTYEVRVVAVNASGESRAAFASGTPAEAES